VHRHVPVYRLCSKQTVTWHCQVLRLYRTATWVGRYALESSPHQCAPTAPKPTHPPEPATGPHCNRDSRPAQAHLTQQSSPIQQPHAITPNTYSPLRLCLPPTHAAVYNSPLVLLVHGLADDHGLILHRGPHAHEVPGLRAPLDVLLQLHLRSDQQSQDMTVSDGTVIAASARNSTAVPWRYRQA
jgi:hypothetical protein